MALIKPECKPTDMHDRRSKGALSSGWASPLDWGDAPQFGGVARYSDE